MKRFPLMLASATLGLALLAGVSRELTADTGSGTPPPDDVGCYHNLWHCSYDGDAYWSDCDAGAAEGWMPTGTARVICKTYHDH